MRQARLATAGGGDATTHRELHNGSVIASDPGQTRQAVSAASLALGGIIAAGHGLAAICSFLGTTPEWLLSQVVTLGLPTPIDRPLRKSSARHAWAPEQVQQLVQLWPSNLFATCIATRIGRTPASVRYKAKWLGLPRRDRASLVRVFPEQALLPLLPLAPAAPVQHRGGRKKLALRVGQDRDYAVEEMKETGLRWFAGQSSDGIAHDFDRRSKQVSNLASRIELPPRHGSRNQLTMEYDSTRRLPEFAQQQFVFRQCLCGGNWFWSTKNGPRISKAHRKSKTWKEKTGGMDDVPGGGTGSDD